MTNPNHYFAHRMERTKASEIRELLKLTENPEILSFAGGLPDPKLFPTAAIDAACHKILSDPKRAAQALQYAASEGYKPLREWLAAEMGKIGVPCTADNVLITNGSQQALDFVGKLFIDRDDTVLVGSPTYLGALQAFNGYEPRYDSLPTPITNRTPESYTAGGKPKPKFGYVMPEFQNPTGTTLSLQERDALLDAAEAMDLPLVEDCAYDRLRYDGEKVSPIIALASKRAGGIDNTNVLYLGTFSKSIAPALRVGWIVGPKAFIEKLVLIKQGADLHTSPFTQMVAYEIASTMIEDHTAKVRKIYRERRDAMLKALETHMPKGVSWTKPEGGMFLWVTLPAQVDTTALMQRAISEQKIAFVPGAAFFHDRSGKNTLRLNFSLGDLGMIEEGMKRLATLLKTVV